MKLKNYKNYCNSFPAVTEEFPFDENTLVYKVEGKIFTLANFSDFKMVSIKCDPEDALAMRAMYKSVIPGYHLNKKHWNSVQISEEVSDDLIKKWIKDSYDIVVSKLPKYIQKELSDSTG